MSPRVKLKNRKELEILKEEWKHLMGIENMKWVDDDLSQSSGRYRRGPWLEELEWAYEFLSDEEITELQSRYLGRGWLPIKRKRFRG